MPTYHEVDSELYTLLDRVLKAHHADLIEAEVTIKLSGARAKLDQAGNPKGPALKHHGVPALAIAKIFGLQDRVDGSRDCRITLDLDQWGDFPERKQMALLHHEASHFLLVRDADGNIQTDDACRPRLQMRPHDFDCGLFWHVVENYGDDSCEAEIWKPANAKMTQLLLPFAG